jgi:hypothetical protein
MSELIYQIMIKRNYIKCYNILTNNKIKKNEMSVENIQKEITASWARETSEAKLGEDLSIQLNNILNKIKDAVDKNKMEVYVTSMDTLVRTELERRGFKIMYYPVTLSSDPIETSYYVIRW